MPVYKDKQRGTWYIPTSDTPKKGFYKKKTVRGFKKKSDALNYERVIMIQLKQKAKYNFVLGLKLEDVIKNSSEIEMVQNKLIELSDKEIGIQNEEIKNIEDDFEELDEVEK